MHQEVQDFLKKTKEKYPEYFVKKRVLELGSLNMNGTPRDFFVDCDYIGIERRVGRDVDIVSDAHKFNSVMPFDVIISTEMLEHDKYADLSIENAKRLLKKDGLLIVTTANINRLPHCEEVGENAYYKNIGKEMVLNWSNNCELLELEEDIGKLDIRFILKKMV